MGLQRCQRCGAVIPSDAYRCRDCQALQPLGRLAIWALALGVPLLGLFGAYCVWWSLFRG
jgi:hypothetical protein